MIKRLTAIFVVLLVIMTALVGCRKEPVIQNSPSPAPDNTPVDIAGTTPAPMQFEPLRLDGSIAAGTGVTYGVASDGSIRFTGRATTGQNLIYGWENIARVETNGTTVVALTADGLVKVAGSLASASAATDLLAGVADIALGSSQMAVLNSDGTVGLFGSSGRNTEIVAGWAGVADIAAAGSHFHAVLSDGTLVSTDAAVQEALSSYTDIVSVDAAEDHIAVITGGGTVVTAPVSSAQTGRVTPNPDSAAAVELEWTDIVRIEAAAAVTFGVDSAGHLHVDGNLRVGGLPTENVYAVASSGSHVAVLMGDGTVRSFGQNDNLELNTEGWRLLPFVQDGYLLGCEPGGNIDGQPCATGAQVEYANPATGEVSAVTCVILGDTNGDGIIDDADISVMQNHIDGVTVLEGAFYRAADIIAENRIDSTGDGAVIPDTDDEELPDIDVVDLEELRAAVNGQREIDQFAKTNAYTTLLGDARRVNTDALGYLMVPNTNISYPIMYGPNWYYNERGLDGQFLERGSIYYYRSRPSQNIVLTGHNARTSGTMFHELHDVQDNAETLLNYSDRVWAFNNYGEFGYWEVWSLYEEGPTSGRDDSSQYYNACWPNTMEAMSEAEIQEWIDYQLERSEVEIEANVTAEDRFITLITCGDSHAESQRGARLYVFLRWVGGC